MTHSEVNSNIFMSGLRIPATTTVINLELVLRGGTHLKETLRKVSGVDAEKQRYRNCDSDSRNVS